MAEGPRRFEEAVSNVPFQRVSEDSVIDSLIQDRERLWNEYLAQQAVTSNVRNSLTRAESDWRRREKSYQKIRKASSEHPQDLEIRNALSIALQARNNALRRVQICRECVDNAGRPLYDARSAWRIARDRVRAYRYRHRVFRFLNHACLTMFPNRQVILDEDDLFKYFRMLDDGTEIHFVLDIQGVKNRFGSFHVATPGNPSYANVISPLNPLFRLYCA